MHFNEIDKFWIDNCKKSPSVYEIIIGKDSSIKVYHSPTQRIVYEFFAMGGLFTIGLLNELGFRAAYEGGSL